MKNIEYALKVMNEDNWEKIWEENKIIECYCPKDVNSSFEQLKCDDDSDCLQCWDLEITANIE